MPNEPSSKSMSHGRDVAVSVVVVTLCSLLGMLAAYVMGASNQQREWAMLYCVAFIGAISSFYCLIKLSQILRLLSSKQIEND
jgi:hypothetical protein